MRHKRYRIQVLHNSGGIGDNIARLPATAYILNHYPEVDVNLWVPDFFSEFARRSLPNLPKERLRVFKFTQSEQYYDESMPTRISDSNAHTNLAYHMTTHGFNLLVNTEVGPEHKNYLPVRVDDIDLSKFSLPEKYVVVTTGFTSPVREFIPETVNKVVSYIKSKGYEVVFLGKTETLNGAKTQDGKEFKIKGVFREEIDYSQGINLIDKTSLLETTKIIYNGKTIVGLDNGLLHVGSTHPELPIVGGFTSVDPKHRMAYRKGILGYNYYPVVPKNLDCIGCQSRLIYYFEHPSFTECPLPGKLGSRGAEIPCLKMLTAELFIEQLEKIL